MAFLKVNYIGCWLLFTTREQRLSAKQPTLKTQKREKGMYIGRKLLPIYFDNLSATLNKLT